LWRISQDMSAVPFHDLQRLKLRPELFLEFLTDRVGFSLLQTLQVMLQA
jgi:hypothetical protein